MAAGRLVPVIEKVNGCAHIGYDARHDRIAVPLTANYRVEFYEVPSVPRSR